MSRRSRTMVLVGILLANLALVPPALAGAGARAILPGDECGQVTLLRRGAPRPGTPAVPVVFVHGINTTATDARWPNPEPRFPDRAWLRGAVEAIPAARPSLPFVLDTFAFDYHADSLDKWVSDAALGPRLAAGLLCLDTSYGHSPVVVAHSMGGLVTRYAAGQPDGRAGRVGDHLGEVITIGTPYRGSDVLTLAQGVSAVVPFPVQAALEAVLAICTTVRTFELAHETASQQDACTIPAVARSRVGAALTNGSADLSALPPWPANLRVHAIAGQIQVGLQAPGWRLPVAEIGDFAVSADSAVAGANEDQPTVITCPETQESVLTLSSSACFHLALIHHPQVVNDVVNEVTLAATASVARAAGSPTPNTTAPTSRPAAVVPAAPSQVTATAISPVDILITWSDNSNNETRFDIVDADGPGTYTMANETSITWSTAPSSTHCFRVRATNTVGSSAFVPRDAVCATTPPVAIPPPPTFVYPVHGQTLDLAGDYQFQVTPTPNASGYLFGFFQDDTMVWENNRDEGVLSGTEYGIDAGSEGHSHFHSGPVDVWVRALVYGEWTDATVITIYLE